MKITRRILTYGLVLSVAALATSVCSAIWSVSNTGDWPKSWPAELDQLRSQSRTLHHNGYTMYHIPFSDRAQFEAAWPHILRIPNVDSPLMLSRGHDRWAAVGFDAGVVIFTPNTGQLMVFRDKEITAYPADTESSIPGGKFLTVGPPWPDEIRDESGDLPEYVVADGERWRPITIQEMREDPLRAIRAQRARTEIRLVIDSKTIDLNRIQLPASVIDKRFEEKPRP